MRLLLLTPPFVQTNCPYPATAHLTGYLRSQGYDVHQRDLSIAVVRDILAEYGGDEAEELLELLSGPLPAEAKLGASAAIDRLALDIRDRFDGDFGFSRYAERLAAAVPDFTALSRRVRRRGVIDAPLEAHLERAMAELAPDAVGVTCPFPGTLVGAFKIARWLRRNHPNVKTLLGGGYVSTELREADDRRIRRYFDRVMLDEGYRQLADFLDGDGGGQSHDVGAFVAPSYDGLDWGEYFDVVETANPMARLWSTGRWRKLQMARGCYWHKCAFCDVNLDYIRRFEMPKPGEIVDAMAALGGDVHFVDEAMPPALVRGVAEEIVRRGLVCRWWGNVRFDGAFTGELCRLMARAGCVAVTGGLECASDRLLKLMSKGITCASARKVLKSFHDAGIRVHAYLMYAFPTETEEEAWAALDYVRRLFRADLVQSAFWHRFALTVHSPIARDCERFGIRLASPPPEKGRVFARNEIAYREKNAPNWERIGRILALATYNFVEGRGLDRPSACWRRLRVRTVV